MEEQNQTAPQNNPIGFGPVPVKTASVAPSPVPKKKHYKILALILIVIVAGGVLFYLWGSNYKAPSSAPLTTSTQNTTPVTTSVKPSQTNAGSPGTKIAPPALPG